MYGNVDMNTEAAYRREQLTKSFRAGASRGTSLRHRRFMRPDLRRPDRRS